MTYPFEFNELLLTERILDILGFSEYWGDCGDSGTRILDLGGDLKDIRLHSKNEYPLYHVHIIDESEDPCSGYCEDAIYNAEHIVTKDWDTIYFIHEMYEDILKRRTPEEVHNFIEKTKKEGVNMYSYIDSYLNFKNK